ncbi:MAG: MFS transporter [Firmicutes bacterium]|nr:MFS transporter [Bacillota bacterium]
MTENAKKESLGSMMLGIVPFWKAQMSDWKVTVIRTSLERLGYQIIYPYLSLYIVALGATKTQLGTITSLGMLMSGLLGPWVGGFIDRNGAKKVYSLGIILLFASYMLYASAPDWRLCIAAMVIYYLGQGLSGQSCATICGNCLKTCDRARGMLVCESLAAGLLGMAGPMIAAFVLVNVLGVEEGAATAADYRYLFFISASFTMISLIVVLRRLTNQKFAVKTPKGGALANGLEILRTNPNARKWLVISAVANLPNALVLPFVQVYAGEVKMASVTVLATMVTAHAVTSTFLGYPVGVLADRFGRKKVIYATTALFWLSMILLITAPSPAVLILAGVLQGFFYISSPLSGAIQRELVSQDVMGTWIGLTKFSNAIVAALMASVGGLIYDNIGPQYVFLVYIACDALIRMPLLASLPETLHSKREDD